MSDQPQDWLKYLFNEDIYILEDSVKAEPRSEQSATPPGSGQAEEQAENALPENEATKKSPAAEVAVIVDESDLQGHRDLLIKILDAVELDLDKIDLFTANDYSAVESDWVFVFGSAGKYDGNTYTILEKGPQKFIISDPLGTLEAERSRKASLWNCLKVFRNR